MQKPFILKTTNALVVLWLTIARCAPSSIASPGNHADTTRAKPE
jgi:hypothetical protein